MGWAQPQPSPHGLSWAQPPKNKKNRKCRNKNFACLKKNIFLSIYSLISGSGIGKNIY
jgi:hypothetical protein